jgi:hypothetical protein
MRYTIFNPGITGNTEACSVLSVKKTCHRHYRSAGIPQAPGSVMTASAARVPVIKHFLLVNIKLTGADQTGCDSRSGVAISAERRNLLVPYPERSRRNFSQYSSRLLISRSKPRWGGE